MRPQARGRAIFSNFRNQIMDKFMKSKIPPPNSPDACFEALWQKCTERVGRGTTRDVYAIADEDKVLKVAITPSYFANWAEIVLYHRAGDKSYFAEVFSWSMSGKYLVMQRLDEVAASELSGHKTPMSITDKKPSNFGKDKSGNIKLLDYAMFSFEHEPLFTMPGV